jgi:hypothetical protein
MWPITAIDGNDIFEQKISATTHDLYLTGYTLQSAAPPAFTVNYRSIGTDPNTIYSTGNASISSGNNVVTFAGGADLPSNIGQGDELMIGAENLYILSRDSATQVTVQANASSTHTNAAYTISRAYNTFQAWEDARDGDLVGENRREVGVAYDDGDFNAGVTIKDSVTDPNHYMKLTVATGQRHSGVAGTGVVVDALGGPGSALFSIQNEYTQIEWLELTNFDKTGILLLATGANALLSNLLIHDWTGASFWGIEALGNVTLRNSILYDGWVGIYTYNSTVYNMSLYGVDLNASASGTIKNTISVGSATADFKLSGTINYFGYNMYSTTSGFDPASYQGNNQSPPTDLEDLFVSIASGTEDLHLESFGHTALNTGVNLAGTVDTDVDDESRPIGSGYEMGADERAASGSAGVNYRSIGTDPNTIYSTGDASISSGTSTVTFAGGASLPTNIGQGDKLAIGAEIFHILSRDSTTQVTIQRTASGTHTNDSYTIERAYNDFQSWETARQGDLVAQNRREVGVAYDDGDFSAGVTIGGSTTDSTHYMHDGTAGTGVVVDAISVTGDIFALDDEYTVIEWLELRNFDGGLNSDGFDVGDSNGTGSLLQNLIIHDYDAADHAIRSQVDATIRNTIVYDGQNGIKVYSGGALTIENVTIYGMVNDGFIAGADAGSLTARNMISVGNGGEDFDIDGPITYFGYNMYDPNNILGFDPASYQGNNQTPPASLDRGELGEPASRGLGTQRHRHGRESRGLRR